MMAHMPKVVNAFSIGFGPRANDLFPIGKARHEADIRRIGWHVRKIPEAEVAALPFAGRTLLVGRLFLTAFVLDDALTLFRGHAPHKSRGVARRKRFFQRLIDFALAPFNVLWCAHPEGTIHYCMCSNFAMCPQKATSASPEPMSALPPKADIDQTIADVRLVPCVDGSELARAFFT